METPKRSSLPPVYMMRTPQEKLINDPLIFKPKILWVSFSNEIKPLFVFQAPQRPRMFAVRVDNDNGGTPVRQDVVYHPNLSFDQHDGEGDGASRA
jgi:hypothetical protein